jgi:hypothetical protein
LTLVQNLVAGNQNVAIHATGNGAPIAMISNTIVSRIKRGQENVKTKIARPQRSRPVAGLDRRRRSFL